MKVKIIKCSGLHYWYQGMEGQIIENVIPSGVKGVFQVKDHPMEFILKKDFEVVSIKPEELHFLKR
jgi:hypothetical protein